MNWITNFWTGLVKFGFRLLYNELAWTYDVVSWLVSLGEWRHWQQASLAYLPEPTRNDRPHLLEIGHGPGHMLIETAGRGYVVTGCDLSRSMGRLAQSRLRQEGENAVSLIRAAVPDLPFIDGQFEAVLSQFPTAFILQPATAAAIYRLLKPGGRLVILPEGHLTGVSLIHRFIGWLFRITGQSAGAAGGDLSEMIQAVWVNLYNEAGFSTECQIVRRPHSMCTVVVAYKPPPPPSPPMGLGE